jgi:hypothetical protein
MYVDVTRQYDLPVKQGCNSAPQVGCLRHRDGRLDCLRGHHEPVPVFLLVVGGRKEGL